VIRMSKKSRNAKGLDRIDRQILQCLQIDGRISNVQLARKVNLTATPCIERVKRLEKQGYIRGYTAILDPELVDASVLVFVEIDLSHNSPEAFREFREKARRLPEIMDCHLISGNFDYLIKARVKDMKAYRRLLGEKILSLPWVNSSRSYVVMEEVKETSHLPLF
jgi:Lrp/AsnC family leucine-responsive transcriptional regulator